MAKQQFQQPQRRRKDDDDAYSDDGGWAPGGAGHANDASQSAQDSLDNIDDVLAQQEGLAGSPEQPAVSPEEGGLYNPGGDAANTDAGEQKDAAAGGENAPWKVGNDLTDTAAAATPVGFASKLKGALFGSKKRSATTTMAGTAVSLLTLFTLTVGSGPAQLINYGQILGLPGKPQQSAADGRLSKELRWAKSGEVGQTRLGNLESLIHKNVQARFAAQGVDIESDRLTGQIKTVTIELDKNPTYRGMTQAEAAKTFAADNGMSLSKVDTKGSGRISADVSDMKITAQRGLIGKFVADGNYGKISSLEVMRVEGKFYAADSWFHPLKRAAAAGDKAIGDKITAKVAAADEDSRTKTLVEKAQSVKDFNTDIRKKIGTRNLTIAGTGLIATQAICIAKDVAHDVPELNRVNVVVPAVQSAGDAASIGSQLMAGQDVDINQVGAVASSFTAKDGSTPWQSEGIQHLENQTSKNGTPIDPAMGQAFSQDSNATNVENTLDAFGAAQMCSVVGKAVQGIAGGLLLLTGAGGLIEKGVQAGVGAALSVAIAQLTSHLEQSLADAPITGTPHQGTQGGNVDAYGAIELASSSARQNGGVAMSGADSQKLTEAQNQESKREFDSKSLASRLFDTHDYRSAASKVIESQNPNPIGNVAGMLNHSVGYFTQIGNVFSQLASAFQPHASAAAANSNGWYNLGYDIKQYGFTESELNNPLVANPFDNANAVVQLVGTSGSDTYNGYNDRIQKCFGDELAQDDSGNLTVNAAPGDSSDPSTLGGPNPASSDYQNANCGDKSLAWLRIRFFIFDTMTAEGYACYIGDGQSCQDLGVPTAAADTSSGGTSFRIATFNMRVGTTPAQNQVAVDNMKSNHFNVVGMQELSHEDTFNTVKSKLAAAGYDIYPKQYTGTWDMNSTAIAYDTSKFDFVQADSVTYPGGDHADCDPGACHRPGIATTSPVIWLRDKVSGQEVIVSNVHWFAFGKTAEWNGPQIRDDAAKAITAKIQSLQSQNLPIFLTGDFNEGYGPQGSTYCTLETQKLMISPFVDSPNDFCKAGGQVYAMGAVDHILTSPEVQGTANELTAEGSPGADGVYANLGTDHKQVPYSDVVVQGTGNTGGSFNIASYNIQGESHNSGDWKARADKVVATVNKENIGVMGGQEMQSNQREYIVNKLGYGVFPALSSPDTGHRTENSILWDKVEFSQVGNGGIITGPKYFCGSGLDVPYVKLKNQSGQQFYVINTHDPATDANEDRGCSGVQSKQERLDNAKIYLNFIQQLKQKGDLPVFLTGDFNSGYTVASSGVNGPLNGQAQNLTYCIITNGNLMNDANDVFNKRPSKCPDPAFDSSRLGGGVDHVFTSKGVDVTSWKTLTGAQAGTDHAFIQIYGITMPGGDDSSTSKQAPAIAGVKNFRDAGALTGALKTGVLYRSGDLNDITVKGAQTLADTLNTNGTIIDLRAAETRKSVPDIPITGSRNISVPMQGLLFQAPMVTDASRRQEVAKALKLAENANGPVLIHCTDGKDRTGWLVAMIMYNAGASDAQVMNEYLESNKAFPGGVKADYLNSGINAIHSKYGTVHNYLTKGLGLSANDLKQLNQKFGAKN